MRRGADALQHRLRAPRDFLDWALELVEVQVEMVEVSVRRDTLRGAGELLQVAIDVHGGRRGELVGENGRLGLGFRRNRHCLGILGTLRFGFGEREKNVFLLFLTEN